MADDIEKGLSGEDDTIRDEPENEMDIDNGVVPLDDDEEDNRGGNGFTSAESTPEHLLTERTPLTKSGCKSNDIELQDLTKKKRRLTPEVVNSSLNYAWGALIIFCLFCPLLM